jgi:hypothetical protein
LVPFRAAMAARHRVALRASTRVPDSAMRHRSDGAQSYAAPRE